MISVVIPSYNRRDGMLRLLADVYLQEGVEFEVIVVDDCSSDDSVAAISRAFPSTKILVNTVNCGPAVTRNRGISTASGGLIVGFDSDITIPNRHLLSIVATALEENQPYAGLAMRILESNGEKDDLGRWWHPHLATNFADKYFDTYYFSGTAYAFRRDAVIAAGLFADLFYMHYEEVELAWRILDNGGRILYSPSLVVIHHVTFVSRRTNVEIYLKPRNQILLAVSCLPLFAAIIYVTKRTPFQFLKACSRGHISDFLSSLASAWKLLPQQLALRRPLRRLTLVRMKQLKAQRSHPSPP